MPALYFYAKNGYNIKCDCGSAKRGTIRYQKKIKVRGETMYTCAKCNVLACGSQDPAVREKMPKNCPMREKEKMEGAYEKYALEENHEFYVSCSEIEGEGYCRGLRKEARVVADLFTAQGFDVVSVICKTGGFPKESVGIPKEKKVNADAFEPMCNPIAQAEFLNSQETEFNIALGLCVGHDSMFYKYSKQMVTTLVAKDRVLAHNPCGAIYCAEGYFKKRLQ